jgi:hypothetical protein
MPMRVRRVIAGGESGNAIVEFVFVAVLILVPTVYLVTAVAAVGRNRTAVTQAAREAGRAFATSDSTADGLARVQAAARLALADEGLPDDARVRFVAVADACDGTPIAPVLAPRAEFAICVTRQAELPGIPTLLAGRGITTVGRYIVHVDDFRTVGPR